MAIDQDILLYGSGSPRASRRSPRCGIRFALSIAEEVSMERSAGSRKLGIMLAVAAICLTICSGQALAQCRDHPAGSTAVRFVNESSYELTFFIEDDDKGTVAIGAASPEWEVYPGEHLLRAGAIVDNQALWVWVVNEIPRGQVCTWDNN